MTDSINTYIGFHATDIKYAKLIIENEFLVKPNDMQWLGQGIYFYLDKELAKWWTTRPSRRFGCNIKNAAIIEAKIQCSKDTCFDMRDVKVYRIAEKLFTEYFGEIYDNLDIDTPIGIDKLKCSFFDWLKARYLINVIIGVFSDNEKAYLESTNLSIIHMTFGEVQLCVTDNTCIIEKKLSTI